MSRPAFCGIEVLFKKAAIDPAFKAELLDRRAAAAEQIGLELDPAEAMVLSTIPAEQLQTVIAQTEVPQEHRRAFLGQAAAAMLAALGVVAGRPQFAAGIDEPAAAGGVRPGQGASRGVQPDLPEGGIRPTLPPKKPKTIEERVVTLLAQRTKVEVKEITNDKSLVKDLEFNSRGLARLRTALEKEFDLKIPAAEFKKVHTVSETIEYVEKAVEKRTADKQKAPPADSQPAVPIPPIMVGGVRPG
jgi:acyl carrier protein